MSWREVKRKVKRQFSDFFEIPGDVMLDLPKIILIGNIAFYREPPGDYQIHPGRFAGERGGRRGGGTVRFPPSMA